MMNSVSLPLYTKDLYLRTGNHINYVGVPDIKQGVIRSDSDFRLLASLEQEIIKYE